MADPPPHRAWSPVGGAHGGWLRMYKHSALTVERSKKEKDMKILYTAEAVVTGGRAGHGRTSDGRLDDQRSAPQETRRAGGPRPNPQPLLAVASPACYQRGVAEAARGRAPH